MHKAIGWLMVLGALALMAALGVAKYRFALELAAAGADNPFASSPLDMFVRTLRADWFAFVFGLLVIVSGAIVIRRSPTQTAVPHWSYPLRRGGWLVYNRVMAWVYALGGAAVALLLVVGAYRRLIRLPSMEWASPSVRMIAWQNGGAFALALLVVALGAWMIVCHRRADRLAAELEEYRRA